MTQLLVAVLVAIIGECEGQLQGQHVMTVGTPSTCEQEKATVGDSVRIMNSVDGMHFGNLAVVLAEGPDGVRLEAQGVDKHEWWRASMLQFVGKGRKAYDDSMIAQSELHGHDATTVTSSATEKVHDATSATSSATEQVKARDDDSTCVDCFTELCEETVVQKHDVVNIQENRVLIVDMKTVFIAVVMSVVAVFMSVMVMLCLCRSCIIQAYSEGVAEKRERSAERKRTASFLEEFTPEMKKKKVDTDAKDKDKKNKKDTNDAKDKDKKDTKDNKDKKSGSPPTSSSS